MAGLDPEEPFDLRRHEWQLSAVKPTLANSPWYAACRSLLPMASRMRSGRY